MSQALTRDLMAGLLAILMLGHTSSQGAITAIRLTPDQITLPQAPGCAQQAVVAGDMAGKGLYATRMRFASGCRVQPHSHPNDRVVVVLSGTMYVGFGTTFDEARLTPLPAGSVWTEPGNQPHFGWARDSDVILQVAGIGPYGIAQAGK